VDLKLTPLRAEPGAESQQRGHIHARLEKLALRVHMPDHFLRIEIEGAVSASNLPMRVLRARKATSPLVESRNGKCSRRASLHVAFGNATGPG